MSNPVFPGMNSKALLMPAMLFFTAAIVSFIAYCVVWALLSPIHLLIRRRGKLDRTGFQLCDWFSLVILYQMLLGVLAAAIPDRQIWLVIIIIGGLLILIIWRASVRTSNELGLTNGFQRILLTTVLFPLASVGGVGVISLPFVFASTSQIIVVLIGPVVVVAFYGGIYLLAVWIASRASTITAIDEDQIQTSDEAASV